MPKLLNPTYVFLTLFWVTPLFSTSAAEMRVTMEPPQGWVVEHSEKSTKKANPEIVFLAPKGRDACFIINDIGGFIQSADKDKYLRKTHLFWYHMVRKKLPERDNLEKFSTRNGVYMISIFEDPKLKGKPVVLGNYKYTIHITGIVDGKRVVNCGLLSHEKDGKDLKEVKAALSKLRAK
ncbi:hypothetical protein HW115_18705 [Verrucomicrobiaceae bacterium N1E253]|uniref:Uncharacterized protein n=1 Tax=Oceaniferula marina TaxID=2748318 RepID=A0A851GRA7_9BACT|nr:hypothetical protein [Oceaniferula marina]NWK57655.1 hypothetical protein [Oceaniferula marina]